MVETLRGADQHKYLSKKLPGGLKTKAAIDVAHRDPGAWMKFHEHGRTLLNRHLSLRLRRIVFYAVIKVVWFDDLSIDYVPTFSPGRCLGTNAGVDRWLGSGAAWQLAFGEDTHESKTGSC